MTQQFNFFKAIAKLSIVGFFSFTMMNAEAQNVGDGEAAGATILVPNAFTPNGDGIDDVFSIITDENAEVVDFRIFNRIGQPVWEANKNIGWDGNLAGVPQPMETYVYCAIVLDKTTGQKVFKKGDVTLIR